MSYKEFVQSTGFVPSSIHRRSYSARAISPPPQSSEWSSNARAVSYSPFPSSSQPNKRSIGASLTSHPSTTAYELPAAPIQRPAPTKTTISVQDPVQSAQRIQSLQSVLPQTPAAKPCTFERLPLTDDQIDAALKTCLEIQKTATSIHSKRPFAALLLGPDNTTILQTHFSISHVQHAESELARLASISYSQPYLWSCTLVSTWEPCAMCTGTIYWSNIGRILYAASEEKLKDLTGPNNEENMTMSLPCRDVISKGQKEVEISGPIPKWEELVIKHAKEWWKDHLDVLTPIRSNGAVSSDGVDGVVTPQSSKNGVGLSRSASTASTSSRAVVWDEHDTSLGRIDEDGDYKADLQGLDWMRY